MVKIQLNDLAPSKWVNIIPESKYVMEATTVGKNLFAVTTKDVMKQVTQYDLDGKKIREVQLPGLGSVTGFEGKENDQTTYFTFTNTVTPPTHYQYDIATGASTVYTQPKIQLDLSQFEMKQVFYTSKDGTKVPMTISYRKGLKLDGKNPTILYGYGGFNNVQSPTFSLYIATWIRHGGVYAVANLRGGGEYGQAWYDQGRLTKKRNVFDDFIAAANYLKAEKYTSTDYLAIKGGSNGGLLVGATMTIEPSVSKVALPAVGVLDMLRYHKFTAGAGWAYDYGTSDDSKEMFEYLLSYSPVHNVKANTVYPATLVTTGDHDDRVVPAHSFKFGAKLQELNVGNNPQLIRINVKAGHGAGKSTEVLIQEMVDEMSFSLWNMGFKTLPK
jgi:prolyl oligopeptidase